MAEATVITVDSDEAANTIIENHEINEGIKYVVRKSKLPGLSRIQSIQNQNRILFQAEGRNSVPIAYDGVPFIILSSDIRECQYGAQRIKEDLEETHNDHKYDMGKNTRQHIQPTKKQNCPAKIKLRRIIKLPEYKIEEPSSKWKRQQICKKIREEFDDDHTKQQYCVLIQFVGEHNNHLTGKLSGYCNRIDKRIIQNIKLLASEGVVNVSEVHRRSQQFAEGIATPNSESYDRRFYPKRKDVYNHIYNAMADTGSNKGDQVTIVQCVDEWREQAQQDDSIFFRPMSEKEQLLFVYQSAFQKHLLQKYGQELCLLDSTYKTTKYTVPLSFICVRTNVGYQVVATFVLGKETTVNIAEALNMVADWNPRWKPEFWLTDFDQREISALEQIFPDTCVLLCDFHREQAWQRWLGAKKNGVSNEKDDIIQQMRIIARARNEAKFHEEVVTLRNFEAYKTKVTFRNWVDRHWLAECKRWVYCFRKHLLNISINTTNGVERQHKLLKEKYLKENGFGGTLKSLLTVLMKKFFPEMQEKYVRNNILSLETAKVYTQHIPEFLKGKPKSFTKHCIKRMPPSVEPISVVCKSQNEFSVGDYTICYDSQVPQCSCQDFANHHWPCKHILAVFYEFPQYGWDTLNPLYTNQPCFNIDTDVLSPTPSSNTSGTNNINEQMTINLETSDNEMEYVKPCSVRKQCIEVLKNVQNNIYGSEDVNVLTFVANKLQEIDHYLDLHCCKIEGIPSRLKRKNTKKRPMTKTKPTQNHNQIPKIVPIESGIIIDEDLNIQTTDDNNIDSNIDDNICQDEIPLLKVIDEIWINPERNLNYQIGKIGPYLLTAESIKFLQSTLSDEVIDAYLYLLCKSRNILHISCVVMTAIFSGKDAIHSLLRQENVQDYNYCIGAINERGNHWTLMIICPSEKKILYINPLGESEFSKQHLLLRWYTFLNARYTASIEEGVTEAWNIESPPHAKQLDGLSCGVYVLKLAERFINGNSLEFTWTRDKIVNVRRAIAAYLLHSAEKELVTMTDDKLSDSDIACLTDSEEVIQEKEGTCTSKPSRIKNQKKRSSFIYPEMRKKARKTYCTCNKPYDGELVIQCDLCNGWFHPACAGLDERSIPKKNDHFFCLKCGHVSLPPMFHEEDVDDTNDNFYIKTEAVCKHMKAAMIRGLKIISNQTKNRKQPWMKRHDLFKDGKLQEKHGYGFAVFSQSAILSVSFLMKEKFLKYEHRSLFDRSGNVVGMKDHDLQKACAEDKDYAETYIDKVLAKEALCAIFQSLTSDSYEVADAECSCALNKVKSKALYDGIVIGEQKKHELEQRYRRD